MDKNKDYSKEFISADFPFKASRTIQQMVQLRQKFPNVQGSSKIKNLYQHDQTKSQFQKQQNIEAKSFQKGLRRTMSTFKMPQNIYIDQDDFYLTPEEIGQEFSKSSKRSVKDQQVQKLDFNKTMKGREIQSKMCTSQQLFKEITISLTDPVYKVNVDKIREMNKQSIYKAEIQLQQHQLNISKQQNQDLSISLAGKKALNISKLQQSDNKGMTDQSKILNSSKLYLQNKKSLGTEYLNESIGNHHHSLSMNSPLPDYYSSLPISIQSKHQIHQLITKVEENNKQINDYQLNKSQMVLPLQQEDEVKTEQEYESTGRKFQTFRNLKWLRHHRKSSSDSVSFFNQKDQKGGDSKIIQNSQTIINQSQIQGNQILIDESSIIGKKIETVGDYTIQDRTNHILSFHSESEIRLSNPIIGSIRNIENKEGDTTFNNNPFLQEDDLSIVVNQVGDDLLIIKIPNLQNYKVQPLELFDSYLNQDPDPLELIKESTIRAYSKWLKPNGEMVWKDCQILNYNPNTRRFLIKWISNEKMKEVTRLNLMYEWENEDMMNRRNKEAIKKREQLLYYMGMKVFINDEKSQDKSIYFSKQTLMKIVDKVFNSKQAKKGKRLYYKKVVEEILEMFKYEVIKFACEINTVPSLDHFFEAYFPELKQLKLQKQNLVYEIFMHCQNNPDKMVEDQKSAIKKKTEEVSFLRQRNSIKSISPERQKDQPDQIQQETDKLNDNQGSFNRKELFINQSKNQTSVQTPKSLTQQNQLSLNESSDQIQEKLDQEELQGSGKKKSTFFKNIKVKLDQDIKGQVKQDQSIQDKSIQDQASQQLGIDQDKQQEQGHMKRKSSLQSKNTQFYFKSQNTTQYGLIQGISQVNFKRTQYLVSPNSYEFFSLRQTQQEGMNAIVSQCKFTDYEFLTEEIYSFKPQRRFDNDAQNQNNKLEDQDVFKYTQSLKSALIGSKDNGEDNMTIYFQHYAIPQPYFTFLKNKLLNSFYFSNEYHNTVFKRIVPNVISLNM